MLCTYTLEQINEKENKHFTEYLLSFACPNITNAVCLCVRERLHMHTHTFKAKFTQLNRQLVKQGRLQQEAHAHLIRVLMMELRCLPFFSTFLSLCQLKSV